MKKNGFTLVEILAILIVIGIIATAAFPIITSTMKKAKQNLYQEQVAIIEKAAQRWGVENTELLPNGSEPLFVDIIDIQKSGHLTKEDVINPNNHKEMAGCIRISHDMTYDSYEYLYIDSPCISLKTDISGASRPLLLNNMIPITWDDSGKIVKADASNPKDHIWYDYEHKLWANAITVNPLKLKEYQEASPGTLIDVNAITTYFVWIPRFAYAIPTGTGARSIDILFENTNSTKKTGNGSGSSFLTHPAFTFGTEELSGLWVGKFETTGELNALTILPNSVALTNHNIVSFFDAVNSMTTLGNSYGFSSKDGDTHMAKNTEWGAIAYLTHSKYGKNKEVYHNNNANYITGCSAENIDSTATMGCNPYSTTKGFEASTTGNITGIYDMSGGAYEFVMGMDRNHLGSSGFVEVPNARYYDTYETGSTWNDLTAFQRRILGDATLETKDWYQDGAYFVYQDAPWFVRGRTSNEIANMGIFAFGNATGGASSETSTRIVLAPLLQS